MEQEIWKWITGYEGIYKISSYGRVYSYKSNKVMKNSPNTRGYLSVELFNGGSSRKLIHRLVANEFIPNPNNYPQINHIDENPKNNNLSNLEWCTSKYNMNYGNGAKTRHSKIDYTTQERKELARKNGKVVSRKIIQKTKEGEIVMRFNSIKEASNYLNKKNTHIQECCSGKRKHSNGFVWEYDLSEERGSDL